MKHIGKSEDEFEASPIMYLAIFIAALISAFVIAIIVLAFGAQTALSGALIGAIVRIGLGATTTLVKSSFDSPNIPAWALFAG